MPTQDPADGAHLRLPTEIARLEKAVAFFKEAGDDKMLSQIVPQLNGAKERLPHAVKAAEFVSAIGLKHDVELGAYSFNDAVNVVSKVMHEHEQHASGKFVIEPLYVRAHKGVKGVNDGNHCDEQKFSAPRDSAAEVIEHLGLSDPQHMAAAKALFTSKVA
jgi:hypothetical protein